MTIRKFSIPLTTDSSGNCTAYSPYFSGKIEQVQYIKTDFADGVDFTTTLDGTGQTVWTESDVNAAVAKAPRLPVYTTAGVAALYAAGGVAVLDKIAVSRDRVKVVIAQGGNVKTGRLDVTASD